MHDGLAYVYGEWQKAIQDKIKTIQIREGAQDQLDPRRGRVPLHGHKANTFT